MLFDKDFLLDAIHSEKDIVSNRITDIVDNRIFHEIIFKYNDKFYITEYDIIDFPYDFDENVTVNCPEVEAKVTTQLKWLKV